MTKEKKFRIATGYILIAIVLLFTFKFYSSIGFWGAILIIICSPLIGEFGAKMLFKLFGTKNATEEEEEESSTE